jgi:hypothetical protein
MRKKNLRSNQLRVLLLWNLASFLDNIANDIVLVDIAPQMDAHCLLTVEQRVCNTADLAEDDVGNGPRVGVLLQCANVEANRLLDDVVLAVRNEERPVGEMNYRRHDDDACEEWRVVEQLAGETDQRRDVLGRCEAFGCVNFPRLRR